MLCVSLFSLPQSLGYLTVRSALTAAAGSMFSGLCVLKCCKRSAAGSMF